MPLTLPRHVVPSYGTMIESVLMVAVPDSFIAHDTSPGPVALPSAVHPISVGDVRRPSATPLNFKSPGQLALKDPFIDDAVCSLTFHLKSVQVLGVGINVDEVQLPTSELPPAIEGSVSELLCSRPVHPDATAANVNRMRVFFMVISGERDSQSRRSRGNHVVVIGRKCP